MWAEVLSVVVVVSALTVVISWTVGRRRASRGRAEPRRVEPPRVAPPGGGRWVAADPLEAAFPVERTPHERAVGDAAFVDGFIVGRYLEGHQRVVEPGTGAGGSGPAEVPGGDDPSGEPFDPDDDEASWSHATAFGGSGPDEDGHDEFASEHEHEDDALDGIGSDDGFEDGFDDW